MNEMDLKQKVIVMSSFIQHSIKVQLQSDSSIFGHLHISLKWQFIKKAFSFEKWVLYSGNSQMFSKKIHEKNAN